MFTPRPLLLLLWCCLLLCLFCAPVPIVAKDNELPDESFFLMCSGGDVAKLEAVLEFHPGWVHIPTESGEFCLHLTGIMGETEVTRLLLKKGADPNIRSTFAQGLRMHPLSWNVYAGHYDNAKLLLDAGAHVNADFDLKMGDKLDVVTVLDIIRMIKGDSTDFDKLEALLLEHGAMTYAEVSDEGSGDL